MSKQPQVVDIASCSDSELNQLVDTCAQTLYFELGGLGLASQASSSAASSSSSAPVFVPLVPRGARGKFYTKAPDRSSLEFDADLKQQLTAEYEAIFKELIAPHIEGISNEPSDPDTRKAFIKQMKKLMCPGCLEHREGSLMERDHMAAFAKVKSRLNQFLSFLNQPGSRKFADKLVEHRLMRGIFQKKRTQYGIRGSGLARLYSAHYNIWLLCRLCNGGKSDQDPEEWLTKHPDLKGFLKHLAAQGLSITEGVLFSGLFGQTVPGKRMDVSGRLVVLHASKMKSLGIAVLRWVCSSKKMLVVALGSLELLKVGLRAELEAVKGDQTATEQVSQKIQALNRMHKATSSRTPLSARLALARLRRSAKKLKAKSAIQDEVHSSIEEVLMPSQVGEVFACLSDDKSALINTPSLRRLRDTVTSLVKRLKAGSINQKKLVQLLKKEFSRYSVTIERKCAAPDRVDETASVNVSEEEQEDAADLATAHANSSSSSSSSSSSRFVSIFKQVAASSTSSTTVGLSSTSSDADNNSSATVSPPQKRVCSSKGVTKAEDSEKDDSAGLGSLGGSVS